MVTVERFFEVIEGYTRWKRVVLEDGGICLRVAEKRIRAEHFTLANIAKEGVEPVYIDPLRAHPFPYISSEIEELVQKFVLVERFPKKKLKK